MSVGSLSPTALIFRAPHRSGDPVVDARSFLCRNGHGLRAAIRSLPVQEGFPLKFPFTSLLFLPVSRNGAQAFLCGSPRTGSQILKPHPLRPCSDAPGCLALRHVLRACPRLLVARPDTTIASPSGPGYHALSPGPSGDRAHHRPVAPKTEPVTSNQINVSGRDGAGRMLVRRTAAIRNGDTPKKGTRGSARSSPRLPSRKETP